MTQTQNVLIIDKHTLMREGLRCLLEKRLGSGDTIVTTLPDDKLIMDHCHQHKINIVLLSLNSEIDTGVLLIERLRKAFPDIKILVYSLHEHQDLIINLIKAGADGYILNTCSIDEFAHALKLVHAGRLYIDCSVMPNVVKNHGEYLVATNRWSKDASENQ